MALAGQRVRKSWLEARGGEKPLGPATTFEAGWPDP